MRNGLEAADLVPEESAVLSRVIRDISAEEADFLLANFSYDSVRLANESKGSTDGDERTTLTVPPDSREGLVVVGLISLGLLNPGEPSWQGGDSYRYATVTAKLLALLRSDDADTDFSAST